MKIFEYLNIIKYLTMLFLFSPQNSHHQPCTSLFFILEHFQILAGKKIKKFKKNSKNKLKYNWRVSTFKRCFPMSWAKTQAPLWSTGCLRVRRLLLEISINRREEWWICQWMMMTQSLNHNSISASSFNHIPRI